MTNSREHYDALLADHYSWLFGGVEAQAEENRRFFRSHGITPAGTGTALDLGAGSGFQSIPLAQLGFNVTAIDLSPKLLAELALHKNALPITIIEDDCMNFPKHLESKVELCVCMGDTLTHLESRNEVTALCRLVYDALEEGGKFIVTFRDLMHELRGVDRFIPVKSGPDTIFTCFLEYEPEHVNVHDLVYEKNVAGWSLKKSMYRKCRIPFEWMKETLTATGFRVELSTLENGLITIIASGQARL